MYHEIIALRSSSIPLSIVRFSKSSPRHWESTVCRCNKPRRTAVFVFTDSLFYNILLSDAANIQKCLCFQIHFSIKYIFMEPKNLQDMVRCNICETPNPALHCEMCNNHLCKDCEKNHLSERRTEHKVVPFYLRGCIKKCT